MENNMETQKISYRPLDLAAIEARHAAATPGPWQWNEHETGWLESTTEMEQEVGDYGQVLSTYGACVFGHQQDSNPPGDREFIAHSWKDVADLLAELTRLRQVEAEAVRLWDRFVTPKVTAMCDECEAGRDHLISTCKYVTHQGAFLHEAYPGIADATQKRDACPNHTEHIPASDGGSERWCYLCGQKLSAAAKREVAGG